MLDEFVRHYKEIDEYLDEYLEIILTMWRPTMTPTISCQYAGFPFGHIYLLVCNISTNGYPVRMRGTNPMYLIHGHLVLRDTLRSIVLIIQN